MTVQSERTLTAAFGAAIKGRRAGQQDAFRSVWLAGEQAWLLAVADGMGGHAAGDVASRVAADAFVTTFPALRSGGASLKGAFRGALDEANAGVATHQADVPETAGMGTTIVAAHVGNSGLAWISVGDSPLWLVRNGALTRVNADHSLRSAAASGANVNANMVLSALTGGAIALIDCRANPLPLRAGDFVVLASDGLLTLSDSEISRTIVDNAATSPEAIARALLKAVEDRDAPQQDNCTVIVAAPPLTASASGSRRWLAAVVLVSVILVAVIGYLAWP